MTRFYKMYDYFSFLNGSKYPRENLELFPLFKGSLKMARLREGGKIRYRFEEESFSNDFYHKGKNILEI